MTTYRFGELGKWNAKALRRVQAAAKTATLNVANDANTPGPSKGNPEGGAGGRMPTVTGFLRNSMVGAINATPRGPGRNDGAGAVSYTAGGAVAATIARWNPVSPDSITIGWSAVYARRMEYRYGFLRGATEKWDNYVEMAARQAELSIP